jgi:hypothetical protein
VLAVEVDGLVGAGVLGAVGLLSLALWSMLGYARGYGLRFSVCIG